MKKLGSQCVVDGKTHYQRNKEYYIKRNQDRRIFLRDEVRKIKSEIGCKDCNIKDFRVLDFDHNPDTVKRANIADLVKKGASLNSIKIEMKKCQIRCANCHRIKTWERNNC